MVSLSPDELILFQSPAKYHGTKGTFFLTNKKVTFDYEQRGIIFKAQYTALNLPLEKISTLSIVGAGPFKKLAINTVRDNESFGIPRHEFSVDNPEKWMTEIEVARRTQKESVFTIQREIKEITKEVVKIKCPYCGMLVEQTLSRCPNCNGLIK
jgi:predicted RNA-binding Zn-ribbon protein involved in translation (DUF1610 family)